MNKCVCGAISRTNYPFGKKSKSRTYFKIQHAGRCQHRIKATNPKERLK